MMFRMNLILKQFLGKRGKYLSSFTSADDRSLSVSRKFYKTIKENFPKQKRKHNVSLNLWHEVNTKLSILWFITNNNRGIIQNPVRMV